MKWYYIFIAIPIVFLIAQSPSARLHVIEKPTKIIGFLNVQGNIFPVWGDRYSLGTPTYVWDSVYANYLMGQIDTTEAAFQAYVAGHGGGGAWDRDSTDAYWGDSIPIVRGNAQAYIEDSLDFYLLISRHNDTIAVLRGNISAYIEDSLDSYLLISRHNDSLAVVRGNIPDSINVARVVTNTWTFPKVVTDTVGEVGTARADSIQIGGGGVLIKTVKVGSHLAIIFSGSDTLWAAADTTNF